MKIKFRLLLALSLAVFFLTGCDDKKDEPQIEYSRAFIMYLVANNNLNSVLYNNMEDAVRAVAKNFPENYSLYIYWDGFSETTLYKVIPPTESGASATKEIVKSYPDQSSVDPAVMKQVLNDVKSDAGADRYGISLGSHATGWFPSSIRISGQRIPADKIPVAEHDLSKPEGADVLLTRSFGDDGGSAMSIADLAEGLSAIPFEYIIFDACFMSSIEALYDLRNSAEYIVASPAEVIGSGYPFTKIIPELYNTRANYTMEKRLTKVSSIFVDFYRAKPGASQSGAMTVIKTSELEGLAQSVRAIVDDGLEINYDIDDIQPLERITPHHAFFDLEDYISNVCSNTTLLKNFRDALGKTVIYNDNTTLIYSVYGNSSDGYQFEASRMSGVASYIPREELPVTKGAYMNTAWAKYIYRTN